jgi:hypothetical protein
VLGYTLESKVRPLHQGPLTIKEKTHKLWGEESKAISRISFYLVFFSFIISYEDDFHPNYV